MEIDKATIWSDDSDVVTYTSGTFHGGPGPDHEGGYLLTVPLDEAKLPPVDIEHAEALVTVDDTSYAGRVQSAAATDDRLSLSIDPE